MLRWCAVGSAVNPVLAACYAWCSGHAGSGKTRTPGYVAPACACGAPACACGASAFRGTFSRPSSLPITTLNRPAGVLPDVLASPANAIGRCKVSCHSR